MIGLDTLDGEGKFLDAVLNEFGGGVGAVLLKGLQVAEAAVFVEEGILIIPALFGGGGRKAG